MNTSISQNAARRLAIASQGLHQSLPFGKSKRGVCKAISHLGYVQIDTISVTERAHNHVLWSRVPDFHQKHLLDLQKKDRKVFEFWAHAAAYLPIEDYRFCLPTMEYFRNHHDPWPKSDRKTMQYVLKRIRDEGPLKSRDFDAPKHREGTGWWDWKPAKLALQRLFFCGDLMISHREGFQRVYDVPESILPQDIDTTSPTTDAYAQYLVRSAIRAHGLIRPQEASYLRKGMGAAVRNALKEMLDEGNISEVDVSGVKGPFYSTEEILNAPVRITRKVRLLSPFDNAVIQRDRLNDLFGFDYQIEVYVPKPKRKFGYYCLPILYGDRFVGRVDVKADRKPGELQAVHLHMEDKKLPGNLAPEIATALREFASFNNCHSIVVQNATPRIWKAEVQRHL